MLRDTLRLTVGLMAAFGMFNAIVGAVYPSLDANVWWIDLRWLPVWAGTTTTLVLTGAILASVVRPQHRQLRRLGVLAAAALAFAALVDTLRFFTLLHQGLIATTLPIPLSLVLTLVFSLGTWAIAKHAGQPSCPATLARRASLAVLALALVAAFPFLQMLFYGATDYRRPADAILVFGARTYADGAPSDALEDRVRTAVQLYHQGLAPCIIMSGGPGDGLIHETQAMQTLAVSLGVPQDRIILDPQGFNTQHSLVYAATLAPGRILAVSHFYHLPRIKLASERIGLTVYTVPSPQGNRTLRSLPWFMARETAAWWWYYARPILG